MTFIQYCDIFLESIGSWRVVSLLVLIAIFALLRRWHLVLLTVFILSIAFGIIFTSKLTEHGGSLIATFMYLPISFITSLLVGYHLLTMGE